MKSNSCYSAIALGLILALAAFSAYIPHRDYPYPLHVDEWFHITVAEEVINGNAVDLYSGEPFRLGMERAWHLALAGIFLVFPPFKIYVFLVMAMSVLGTLSTYVFAQRYGKKTALIAAFLVALIPSNVTIGGPALLVPVNLSLIFIPLALKFAFGKAPNYPAVFALTAILLYAHPPSAVALLFILGVYAVMEYNADMEKSKKLAMTIIAAVLASVPNYIAQIFEKGIGAANFPFWVIVEETPRLFGYIPTIFFVAGAYMMSRQKYAENRALLVALVFFLIDIAIYTQTSASFIIPYNRIFIPLMLLMSIVAAYSLAKVKNNIVLGVLLAAILAISVQAHLNTPYYHVVSASEFRDIEWIGLNANQSPIILADPWTARAIPAITGMRVYTVLPFGPDEDILKVNQKATAFFRTNCTDTGFLKENNITIVYLPRGAACDNVALNEIHNVALKEIHENVYSVI